MIIIKIIHIIAVVILNVYIKYYFKHNFNKYYFIKDVALAPRKKNVYI